MLLFKQLTSKRCRAFCVCACKRLCSPTRVHPHTHTYTHTLIYRATNSSLVCVSLCVHTLLICSWVLLSLCISGVSDTMLNPRPLLSSKSFLYFTCRRSRGDETLHIKGTVIIWKRLSAMWQFDWQDSIYIWCAATFSSSTSVRLLHKDKHQLGVSSRVLPHLHLLFSVHKRVHTDKCGYMTSTASTQVVHK